MNAPEHSELFQKALRGELTPAEQARLEHFMAADASLRLAFEEERALESALEALPPAPVSSNFTARVVQEALRGQVPSAKRWCWPVPRFGWVPAALTAALIVAGGGVFYQQRLEARQELAQSVAVFSEVASALNAASPESSPAPVSVLENFEAIERLEQMPREQDLDLELFAALQR